MGRDGPGQPLKILPRDGTGRDSLSKSGTGRGTGRGNIFCPGTKGQRDVPSRIVPRDVPSLGNPNLHVINFSVFLSKLIILRFNFLHCCFCNGVQEWKSTFFFFLSASICWSITATKYFLKWGLKLCGIKNIISATDLLLQFPTFPLPIEKLASWQEPFQHQLRKEYSFFINQRHMN